MKVKKFNEYILNENVNNPNIINNILNIFMEITKYNSDTSPKVRYAFKIDMPSANTIYFRTTYFGDWKTNISVSYSIGDDFFRINSGDVRMKSTDFDNLRNILDILHDKKIEKYGNYLSNEYSDELQIKNTMVDIKY